ncbi:pyridoxal phosphate-dependent aminotransferase [Microbacterium sediminicola]|uniref:Aminotransferase n=1 Tax=Microbacterium sediminicola TaxID=415210 RepID=A0ABN2IB21_9MICO
MPDLSPIAGRVPESGIRRIFELAQAIEGVTFLAVGEPELPVAPHILAAGAAAWERDATAYTANSGILPLREAIVTTLARDNGYAVDPDQINVTPGGSQALFLAMTLALAPGDEILVPDPGYATFAMAPRLVGAIPVRYPLHAEHGFIPQLSDLEALVTPSTKALLINSPSNPLGTVLGESTMRELLAFAARHDLWVISDEVYEYLSYDGGFTSAATIAPERTLSVYSLSKTYGLTGARVGYLVSPPGLAHAARQVQEATISCVNEPAQWAALAALEGPQDAVADAVAHYQANLAAARALLDARGIRYLVPGGAFYLWIDVSHASKGDVSAWAESFLMTERVAVAPGSAFGPSGEGWIRVCFAGRTEPLLHGLAKLPVP